MRSTRVKRVTETVGLILGSGYERLGFEVLTRSPTKTPYGEPSSAVLTLGIGGARVPCIVRHGERHEYAPHEINYRANVWALAQRGIGACVGINTVGGIASELVRTDYEFFVGTDSMLVLKRATP